MRCSNSSRPEALGGCSPAIETQAHRSTPIPSTPRRTAMTRSASLGESGQQFRQGTVAGGVGLEIRIVQAEILAVVADEVEQRRVQVADLAMSRQTPVGIFDVVPAAQLPACVAD